MGAGAKGWNKKQTKQFQRTNMVNDVSSPRPITPSDKYTIARKYWRTKPVVVEPSRVLVINSVFSEFYPDLGAVSCHGHRRHFVDLKWYF